MFIKKTAPLSTTPLPSPSASPKKPSSNALSIEVTQLLGDIDLTTQNTIDKFFPGTPVGIANTLTHLSGEIKTKSSTHFDYKSGKRKKELKEEIDGLVRKQHLLTLQDLIFENQATWLKTTSEFIQEGICVAYLAKPLTPNAQTEGAEGAVGFATLISVTEPKKFGSASIYISPTHPEPAPLIAQLVTELESAAKTQNRKKEKKEKLPLLLFTTTDTVQAEVLRAKGYCEAGSLGARDLNGVEYIVLQKKL